MNDNELDAVKDGLEPDRRKTVVREHVNRYFVAHYGDEYVYRAPETFPNVVEQWMLAIAAEQFERADELITSIEERCAATRKYR